MIFQFDSMVIKGEYLTQVFHPRNKKGYVFEDYRLGQIVCHYTNLVISTNIQLQTMPNKNSSKIFSSQLQSILQYLNTSQNFTQSHIYLCSKTTTCQDIQTLRSQLRSTCVIYPLDKSVFIQYALVCICKYSNPTITICSRHRVNRRFNFSQIIPTIDLWLNTRLVQNLYLKSIEGPWLVD